MNPSIPPMFQPYYFFSDNKFDQETAQNVLLWFVYEQGLEGELLEYLKSYYPKEMNR